MAVLFLFVLTLVAIFAVPYAVWPAIKDAANGAHHHPTQDAPVAGEIQRRDAESLEGTLVAQLVAAEISRRQYLHAMERLAARDDVRNPLVLPPEAGSGV